MTFEDGMAKLETIVKSLENGELPLEESFKAYEEGMAISRELHGILDRGDERIRVLTGDGEREMTE